MPSRLFHSLVGLAGIFLSVASCSPAAPTPQAGGGIGGTGSLATVSSGPVTKFGSVFVSGTEYDNSNTLYCIDHEPCSTVNRLKLGMVVLVNGTRTVEYGSNNTLLHTADTITYEETVEGVVQSASADGLSLVVLGQVVSVNLKTEIDPTLQGTMPHSLDPGKILNALVEISGFVTGDGTILATLIQPHTGIPHYEVEGVIKNHDRIANTFDGRTDLSGQGNPTAVGDLHSGDHLQIHGRLRGSGILLATEVERSDPSSQVQLEGYVIDAADPWLTLLGSRIDTTSIPESGFRGRSGTIGRSTFFSGLGTGEQVTLQGRVVGTQVVWTAARRAR
jgi:hypothetical protein